LVEAEQGTQGVLAILETRVMAAAVELVVCQEDIYLAVAVI
jgi:hypothetical protein